MLNTILVPLDGTPLAETALQPATELAHRLDARMILLVRSIDTWPSQEPAPLDTFTALFSAEDYLATLAKQVTTSGVTVHLAISVENPVAGISAEAASSQADLIVMATHGRQGLEALLHPSVTWGVLRQTRAPILTWRVAEAKGKPAESAFVLCFLQDPSAPILVPLDGSLLAEQALPLAKEMAQRLGNPILLVRAAEQPYIAGSAIDYPTVLAHAQKWSLAEATSYLERKRLELSSRGLHVEIDSHLGDAVSVIEEAVQARQAGLLVMASHGRSGLGQMLLGSVARRLLGCLEAPILLVRAHQPGQASAERTEDNREH